MQGLRVVGWPDRRGGLGKHRAGVEAGVHLHDGDAGLRLAVEQGALDRRRAAVGREKGAVDVEAAVRREVENGLRENLAVGGDDDQAGGEWLEGFRVVPEAFRLVHREAARLGLALDRRRLGDELAALRPVRLGEHGDDLDAGRVVERRKAGAGELRRSHEHNSQRRGHGRWGGSGLELGQHLEHVSQDANRRLGGVDGV